MTEPNPEDEDTVPIRGWGRSVTIRGREWLGEELGSAPADVTLARGLGRSYGDASLPAEEGEFIATTRLADRVLAFDAETGVLRAEAGVTVRQIKESFLARGWFLPVCPGTQDVTLGGMVAADVHGKNHHRSGSFGGWVDELAMVVANGDRVTCSPKRVSDLFWATIGGMGLTGIIHEVSIRLVPVPSPWLRQETIRCATVRDLCERLQSTGETSEFTVGWLDLLGPERGVLFAGDWFDEGGRPGATGRAAPRWSVPRNAPRLPLSKGLIRVANTLYHARHRRGVGIVDPESFFFPLDAVRGWNRWYGSEGFFQYQCVVPWGDDGRGAERVIEAFRATGATSYLTVVKDCGEVGRGILSFPMRGVTVTFDVPSVGPATVDQLRALNDRVIEWGGRVYLAKDAITTSEQFRRMEPRLASFLETRRKWDPDDRFESALSRRLFGGSRSEEPGR